MLFNTLAYAKFFCVVFVIYWLLAKRRWALWLPWAALASHSLFATQRPLDAGGLAALGLVAAGFVTTAFFAQRLDARDEAPPRSATLVVALVNLSALAWLLGSDHNLVLAALRALGVLDEFRATELGGAAGVITALLGHATSVAVSVWFLRTKRVRLLFLVLASYVFYAHWDWRFLPLIFASSTLDFWLGAQIGRTEDPRERKRWLLGTVVLNLGVLAVFKYLGFGVRAATDALAALGFHPDPLVIEIALPVGISFFTFESMSYVIDVYRRRIPPHPSYLEYLGFVAFFPHLVAGPIVRPSVLLPQLSRKVFDPVEGSHGLFLIAWGLLKKVAIGDTLALNLVDRVFDAPAQFSSLECYAAVVGYAIQIYCDFSGYTDVAIGSALLLGIRLPLNFDAPYKATGIQDFWRRWHISLSTWLRDYLYIPLGGNRKGPLRTYVNLLLTMLLGGLWHGASYNFIIWGGLHGAGLAVERAVGPRATETTWPRRVVSVFLTFHFVCAAWIFFRAETLAGARLMFTQLAQFTTFHPNLSGVTLGALAAGLVTHFLPEDWYQRFRASFVRAPAWAQGLGLAGAALVLQTMVSREAVPFVYFQF